MVHMHQEKGNQVKVCPDFLTARNIKTLTVRVITWNQSVEKQSTSQSYRMAERDTMLT